MKKNRIAANPCMPEILESLETLGDHITRQARMLAMMQHLTELFMATEQDLRDTINHLRDLIIADQTGDQAVVDSLVAIRDELVQKVKDLQAQIEAGQTPTVDFDGLIAQIQNLETMIVPAKAADAPIVDPTIPSGETEVPIPPGTASLT